MNGQRITVLAALLALAGAPAAARAADPGGAPPDVLRLPGGEEVVVMVGNPLQRAARGGIALTTRSIALVRGRLAVSGTAPRGRTVAFEIRDVGGDGPWTPIGRARAGTDGTFRLAWRANRAGRLLLRARLARTARPTRRSAGPTVELTVYRPGIASWYGPTRGVWQTACGVPLLPTTVGVAHRRLPCGTLVAFHYRGQTLIAPVIDRGPFVPGRVWDLTRAAHRALGATDGLIRVGALPLAAEPAAAGKR